MNIKPTTRRYAQGARALAAEATARRIVEAFLARLMTQWYDEITLDVVAADAEVTVMTVVRRFGGKEGLLRSAVKTLASQIEMQRATTPGNIELLVKNLFADYEQTGDAILRLLALEPRQPSLKEFLDIGRQYHRQWVTKVLADSLQKFDATSRKQAMDALVIITDVYSWKLLRRDMGRSLAASKATMMQMIRAAIADVSTA